jgi:phytoene desaturase
MNQKRPEAAVIGAGVAGLASAIRLAAKGYNVSVYEQAGHAGGKISQLRNQGFRFDTGPSLFTMPWLVDELFELAGENPREHLNYVKLPSSCKYFWDDGTIINAWDDVENFAFEVEEQTGVRMKNILAFLEKSRRLYDITSEVFIFNSLHSWKNWLSAHFRKSMLYLNELDAFTTMHNRNLRWFSHPKVVQLFDRYATYNGSSPYLAPATLNIIAHLEHNTGAFFPVRGMYSIAESLRELAERQGVKFHFRSPVEQIVMQNKQVQGIRVNGEMISSDVVVSDADVRNVYNNLLPGHELPAGVRKSEPSSSALIFYWGIGRQFPEIETHNILFANDYKAEFDHLFNTRTLSPDPTVYLFNSCRMVEGDAPEGMENWYVMINAPHNHGQDWNSMIPEVRRNIINRINHVLKINIEDHILFEHIADPVTIERETGSYGGSLYGSSSNNPFAAFLRHPNFRKQMKGLYFTGGSTHPGGGIPLCLASAKIAVSMVSGE